MSPDRYARKNPQLCALRIVDEPKWLKTVRAALRRTKDVDLAAIELQVDRATLFRWMQMHPELREGLRLPTRRRKAKSAAPQPKEPSLPVENPS